MKLEVNLTHNPYDIIIEKGALKTVGQWGEVTLGTTKDCTYHGQSCGSSICRKS